MASSRFPKPTSQFIIDSGNARAVVIVFPFRERRFSRNHPVERHAYLEYCHEGWRAGEGRKTRLFTGRQ